MDNITLVIDIEPLAKQSARFYAKNNIVKSYQKKEVVSYANEIYRQAKEHLPLGFKPFNSGLVMKATFIFTPLKSFSKSKIKDIENGKIIYKTTKPDNDNLCKGLCDALEELVFVNDSLICVTEIHKIYGIKPRIKVEFKKLNNDSE